MKTRNKTLPIIIEIIGFIGLLAILLFTFVFVKPNYVPFDESNGKSLAAYPPPESTRVETLHPTNSPSTTESPTVEPAITSTPVVLDNGWYRYTDPDLEFSFAYPPNVIISAGQNHFDLSKNITIQFLLPDMPYQGMSIRLEPNPKRLPSADIAKQLFEISAQQQAPDDFANSLTPISVGKLTAVQASIPSMNTETTVIVAFGEKALIIAPVHDTVFTNVEKETLELFYQILGTFEFDIPK